MREQTSGTQALQGRKVNHDKYPWAFSMACSITNQEPWHNNRFATRQDGALLWFPRHEFDVPDNPILAELRRKLANEPIPLQEAVQWFRDWIRYGEARRISATPAEVGFAWRVLTKLAAL